MIKNKIEINNNYIVFPNGIRLYDRENSDFTNKFRLVLCEDTYHKCGSLDIQYYVPVGYDDEGESVSAWRHMDIDPKTKYKSERIIELACYYVMKDMVELSKLGKEVERKPIIEGNFSGANKEDLIVYGGSITELGDFIIH